MTVRSMGGRIRFTAGDANPISVDSVKECRRRGLESKAWKTFVTRGATRRAPAPDNGKGKKMHPTESLDSSPLELELI